MNNLNFEGKKIYLGLDVHKSSWELKVLTEHTTQKQIHLSPGNVESLEKYVKSNYPGGEYFCAYEAGFSGFWLHRQLEQRGINTLVVHPADVPTTDKEKRFKTDKIDCTKIAKALRGGFLTGIYVPDKKQQIDRSVVRQRYRCASDQRRIKNRIKAHLAFFGIQIEWKEGVNESYWSHKMVKNIEQFAEQEDDQTLLGELELLKQLRQAEVRAMRRIRVLSETKPYLNRVAWLRSIKGVGLLTAMVVLTEVGDIKRFKDLDQLASYVGIVPGSKSSGDAEQVKHMAKRGNKHLRTALVLSAWMAVRNDSGMALYYENYKRRMISQKAIIKIARKLLSRMRHVLIHQCKLDYST
jgi:transposase